MMLPSSICSTLAILIVISQYPSTASFVLTATGSHCLLTMLPATPCFHRPQLAFSIRHLGLASSLCAVHWHYWCGLSLFFFLCSLLCTSSASASLITSFLRSYFSAPCGVVLRHSSIRFLQRSEWSCGLFNLGIQSWLRIRQCLLLGDSSPLGSCSLKWQWRDSDRSTRTWALSTVHFPSVVLQGTLTFCAVVSHPKPNSVLVSGVHPVHRI